MGANSRMMGLVAGVIAKDSFEEILALECNRNK
jgi:hypothetical protein